MFNMQDALDKFYESFIPVRLLGENDFPECNLFVLLIHNHLAKKKKTLIPKQLLRLVL